MATNNFIEPYRSYSVMCVRSLNDLPKAHRWLYKDYVPNAIAQIEPFCRKYANYHALPVPRDGDAYGSYNFMLSEQSLLLDPENLAGQDGMTTSFANVYPDDYEEFTRQPKYAAKESIWQGTRDGYHPIVNVTAPIFWQNDLKGSRRTINDGANYRWFIVHKYPQGVSREEGDDWFFHQLAPQLVELKQVTRFITSAALPNSNGPWSRVTELWFEGCNDWHDAIVKNAPAFAKPAWAKYQQFPYLAPFEDFIGIFLLDRPNMDLLKQYRGYIPAR
jgi:hypothetical protein